MENENALINCHPAPDAGSYKWQLFLFSRSRVGARDDGIIKEQTLITLCV
jgi:hypothetical protein